MAKAIEITVKETLSDLKKLLKRQPEHLRDRIRMLMIIKQSEEPMSKHQLAKAVGVNHNSIQKWRKMYREDGIEKLQEFHRGGFKPSLIDAETHKRIEARLRSPEEAFRSYEELRQWIDENFIPGIKYHMVNKYVKRKFKARLKVARKSHVQKDQQAVEAFKKTSDHPGGKYSK